MPGPGPLGLIGRTGPLRAPTTTAARPVAELQPTHRWLYDSGPKPALWGGPVLVSTTVTTVAAFSATHVYQLPTVAIGDRLVLVASCLDSLAAFTPTTDLSAWTSFLASELNAFHTWRGYTIYIADAAAVTAWSGTTVTFNSTNGGKSTAVVARVANGASGGLDVGFDFAGPSTTGSDANPNPPELVTAWGADQNLWLTWATFGSGGDSATAQPQDYHDLAQGGAAAGQTTTAMAARYKLDVGEDPGAFTLSGTENHQALTFAVRPYVDTTPTPVAGSTRHAITVVARITGTKIATSGATRATANTTTRATATKLALGSMRTAGAPIARITGAAIGAIAGAATIAATITARIAGAKVATSSARATLAVTQRTTAAKIAGGATRAPVSTTQRTTGTKTALSSMRAPIGPVARATGTKIATGAAQVIEAITGLITGAPVTGGTIQGAARALISITARATGTKVAAGSTRATAPTVQRTTGTKVGIGSARITAPVTQRTTATRTALGALRALATPAVRPTGTKTSQGAMRAGAGPYARTTGRKIATGAARIAQAVIVLITPGSQTPPLEVAHRAEATTRHTAIALDRHTTEATTTHTATARRAT